MEQKKNKAIKDNSEDLTQQTTANKDSSIQSSRDNPQKSIGRYYRYLSFTLLIVFGVILFSIIQADFSLYKSNSIDLKLDFDNYYYNGWSIEDDRSQFLSDHSAPLFWAYINSKLSGRDLNYYRKNLYRTTDQQYDQIRTEITRRARISSVFYINEIEQNTAELEDLLTKAEYAVDTQNLYTLSWQLKRIDNEIEQLSKKQNDDIRQKIKAKRSKIEDLAFIGKFYNLDLNKSITEAANINTSPDNPIEAFILLDDIIRRDTNKLNEAFKTRGGSLSVDDKWILIVISQQRLYMVEDYDVIYEMPASTGVYHHATVPGEFAVLEKIDMAWGYYEIWMPYWMTIYYAGSSANGIHGIPISPSGQKWSHWNSVVGVRPITYGCIMPKDPDAKRLYEWAKIGTPVSIF